MTDSNNNPGWIGSIKGLFGQIYGKENLWDNARFIFADVPVDKKAASRRLPWGLKLADPARATLFIVDYTKNSFTFPYHEAGMLLHVRHLFGAGLHCSWMVVDDDTAMIYGRELLGYPKKMGIFEFAEEGEKKSASIERRGFKVLSMEGEIGEKQTKPAPAFDVKTYNAGGPGGLFLFNPVWMFRPIEVIHESHEMDVKVKVEPSELDPLAEMIDGDPLSGRFVVMDIVSSRYMAPVGLTGPGFTGINQTLRAR